MPYRITLSVTCHPTEVTFPPLPQPKMILENEWLSFRRIVRGPTPPSSPALLFSWASTKLSVFWDQNKTPWRRGPPRDIWRVVDRTPPTLTTLHYVHHRGTGTGTQWDGPWTPIYWKPAMVPPSRRRHGPNRKFRIGGRSGVLRNSEWAKTTAMLVIVLVLFLASPELRNSSILSVGISRLRAAVCTNRHKDQHKKSGQRDISL